MTITFHADTAIAAQLYAEQIMGGRVRLVKCAGNVFTFERFKG